MKSVIIAGCVVLSVLSAPGAHTASAQPPVRLAALACQGTVTYETVILKGEIFGKTENDPENAAKKQEKISMGIIINFTDETVQGTFGSIGERLRSWLEKEPHLLGVFDNPHKITTLDETAVGFNYYPSNDAKISSDGLIDRITGDARVYIVSETTDVTFELKCKSTQRMF